MSKKNGVVGRNERHSEQRSKNKQMKHLKISVSFRFDNLLKFDWFEYDGSVPDQVSEVPDFKFGGTRFQVLAVPDLKFRRYRISSFGGTVPYRFSRSQNHAQLKIKVLKNGTGRGLEILILLTESRDFCPKYS